MSGVAPRDDSRAPATPAAAMLRTLGLVAAVSGLLVVLSYRVTLPLIEENKRIAIERALFEVLPGAVQRRDFVLDADGRIGLADGVRGGVPVYAGYAADGQLVGVGLEAAAQGYQDVIRVLYGYQPACHCIRGMQVLKMAETPGIGDRIAKDAVFLRNFDALDVALDAAGGTLANPVVAVKSGTKTQAWQIDAISGATISSNAVARMLNDSASAVLPAIEAQLDTLHLPAAEGGQ